ncbi:pyridoxal-phosphate dependent enzyme [Pareuzebyella sediminis]|uniref:pyridoxal-phosphate dependent enzyme n=1 Tax=Pareuzebyella sediminis TaxID=2607998 RepID=UPI0011EE39E4|nr:pyridoxal-phosphate dependent enzyme [Pareuzebyella sediminis]
MNQKHLLACHERILPYIHRTPVLTSRWINERAGTEVFFKCENFQRGGAYKARGATNAVLQLTDTQKKNGVVTHSSGNFAQALSIAAKNVGAKAFIVMPLTAPKVKKDAVKAYGGNIIECEPTLKAREAMAEKIVREKEATFIHPSNDEQVIMGQGTACMELLEERPGLSAILIPVGGGGLAAGTSLAAYFFGTHCEVWGAEPFSVDDAYRSFKSGKIESNASTETIADGLRTQLGDRSFPIMKKYMKGIIRVEEAEIVETMRFVWERMKIIIEPSSAVALAAVFREKDKFRNKHIGVIISGGNVDLNNLPL